MPVTHPSITPMSFLFKEIVLISCNTKKSSIKFPITDTLVISQHIAYYKKVKMEKEEAGNKGKESCINEEVQDTNNGLLFLLPHCWS